MSNGNGSTICIFMLGRFEVRHNGRILHNDDWSRRKAASLFQRLAVERRLHKEQAIEFLWPDFSPDAGANNLYRTIYALRRTLNKHLGKDVAAATFAFKNGVLSLAQTVWVDVHAFMDLGSQAATAPPATRWTFAEQAVDLYAGDLLPEERYAEWTFAWRDRLHRRYSEICLVLVKHLHETAAYERSIQLLTPLLVDDPANEPIHRELMRAYALAGRRYNALRQYESCLEALSAVLGIPPGQETADLHTQILNGELIDDRH